MVKSEKVEMKEAMYYEGLPECKVKCLLCPQGCKISDGKVGFCRVRKNEAGKLYSLMYNRMTSLALDPIEKKPLYHFHPGKYILSVGTKGCNMACPFCQNWSISQDDGCLTEEISPHELVQKAKEYKSFGIAYTYNEPFIWYEFVLESSNLAKAQGLCNVLVTNGFVNPKPLKDLLPYIDAMNIDLKSMDDDFYRKVCKAGLGPVLETIKSSHKRCHIELTNLIIPTLNDSQENFEKLVDWVVQNLGTQVPLHFSSYFPCFKMDIPSTPIRTLEKAYEIAKKKLKYVYLGNV